MSLGEDSISDAPFLSGSGFPQNRGGSGCSGDTGRDRAVPGDACSWGQSPYPRGLALNLFIYLFLAVLGLCCCAQAFSSCGEQGLLFVVVHGLLIAVASLVAEHRL